MYKYNPADFAPDIADEMQRVYDLYEQNSDLLPWAVDELYYALKDLRTYKIKPASEVIEMQEYFRGLLYA